jgi:hypothetical protein
MIKKLIALDDTIWFICDCIADSLGTTTSALIRNAVTSWLKSTFPVACKYVYSNPDEYIRLLEKWVEANRHADPPPESLEALAINLQHLSQLKIDEKQLRAHSEFMRKNKKKEKKNE